MLNQTSLRLRLWAEGVRITWDNASNGTLDQKACAFLSL